MPVSLVIADVDGTLLDNTHAVGEKIKKLVADVHDHGAIFSLATGRIYASARSVANEAGIRGPVIAGGGAVIGTPGGEVSSRLCLSPETAIEILDTVGKSVFRYAFVNDRIYTDTPGEHIAVYSKAIGVPVLLVNDLREVVSVHTTHIVLRMAPEDAEAAVERFGCLFRGRTRVVRTLPHLVEFVNPHVSKGRALSNLCRLLRISRSAVLAIGDGASDIDMLAVAGIGVLVGNCPDSLKSRCRNVVSGRYTDGVVEAVEKFLKDPYVPVLCRYEGES